LLLRFILSKLDTVREEARVRATLRPVKFVTPAETPIAAPRNFTIVSGIPRSGTSLMMQMLRAGGLEVMTDYQRRADEDNPEGYFEWEEIRNLPKNPELLLRAEGKVIKVISALVPALPPGNNYRVIFMNRPIAEVVASQARMIDRRRTRGPEMPPDRLATTLEQHRALVLRGMRDSPDFELLEIDYPHLIIEPAIWIERILEFLGGTLDSAAMGACIKPSLHRNRASVLAVS
jgi:hypothetical protein